MPLFEKFSTFIYSFLKTFSGKLKKKKKKKLSFIEIQKMKREKFIHLSVAINFSNRCSDIKGKNNNLSFSAVIYFSTSQANRKSFYHRVAEKKEKRRKLIRASVAINFSHRCKEIKRIMSV